MTIPRTYLGVDPGSTTGLAVLRLTGDGYIAAHDQVAGPHDASYWIREHCEGQFIELVYETFYIGGRTLKAANQGVFDALYLVGWIAVECDGWICLLYTSPSPRDATLSRMPSSA